MDYQGIENLSQSQIIDASLKNQAALTRKNSDLRNPLQIRVPVDLSVTQTIDNPYHVAGPFNGFYIETSTDSLANVKLSLSSTDGYNMKNYTTIFQKDSAYSDEPVKDGFLVWDAQPGKMMVLVFYLGISFKPGSYLSAINGAIYENYGNAMTPGAKVAVLASVTSIDTAQVSAKKRTIQVLDGSGVWISGTNSVTDGTGANPGIFVPAGGTYEWLNNGAIYGVGDGGATANVSINTES